MLRPVEHEVHHAVLADGSKTLEHPCVEDGLDELLEGSLGIADVSVDGITEYARPPRERLAHLACLLVCAGVVKRLQ
jgi:hypothetical protein